MGAEWNAIGRGRREKGFKSLASLSKLPHTEYNSDNPAPSVDTAVGPGMLTRTTFPTQCDGAAVARVDCPARCSSPSRVSKFPAWSLTPDRASPQAKHQQDEQKGSAALVSTWCLFLVHHHKLHAHPNAQLHSPSSTVTDNSQTCSFYTCAGFRVLVLLTLKQNTCSSPKIHILTSFPPPHL